MPEFRFIPDPRGYWLGSRRLPSVTEILGDLGIIETEWFTEASRRRGTAVHEACQYLEENDLVWDSLKPIEDFLGEAIIPRVEAWQKFLDNTGWKSTRIEEKQYHPTYLYAGAKDRRGFFPGDRAESILDIKTGALSKWWRWQTGAYEEMDRAHDGIRRHRLCVELRANGTYKRHDHKDHEDSAEFIDLFEAHKIGRSEGYFKRKPDKEKSAL